MAKYTARQNPMVDRVVTNHLARIVSAIREHLEPQSIILYGSFGRGEGSVLPDGDSLIFLSDYEISVVTRSPFHRQRFAHLSRQLTAELGVEVSASWMRPGRLRTNQSQNLSLGPASPTIAMYEIKAGGQTLYGQDLLGQGAMIDPSTIPAWAGIRLLTNRMAEALPHLPGLATPQTDHLETIRCLNKLVLACAEALLLLQRAYHYSYAERGRRFTAIKYQPPDNLLAGLVERATEFKLRPARSLYPPDLEALWPEILIAVEAAFRRLMAQELEIRFDTVDQFPEQFLNHPQVQRSYNLYRLRPLPTPLDQKLVNAFKYLRQRRWPPKGFFDHWPITANLVVFAVIPLLFLGWSVEDAKLAATNAQARRWLGILGYQEPLSSNSQGDWHALVWYTLGAWKNFCYN